MQVTELLFNKFTRLRESDHPEELLLVQATFEWFVLINTEK